MKTDVLIGILILLRSDLLLQEFLKPKRLLFSKFSLDTYGYIYVTICCISKNLKTNNRLRHRLRHHCRRLRRQTSWRWHLDPYSTTTKSTSHYLCGFSFFLLLELFFNFFAPPPQFQIRTHKTCSAKFP